MDATKVDMDRLYELYRVHYTRLRADVSGVNRSLGSTQPTKTWMQLLNRSEFESLVAAPSDEPEVVERMIRRIVRGHEQEFPGLRVA